MRLLSSTSSRRRLGDCHDWTYRLVGEFFPSYTLIFLSLDTAVGGELRNLLDGPGVASLLRLIDAGLIAGSLSGPPRETWSAARNLNIPPDSTCRWPRPLRSAQRAWGLQFLSHRELHQLSTKSALMLANLRFEVGIVLSGGAAMLEHHSTNAQFCS